MLRSAQHIASLEQTLSSLHHHLYTLHEVLLQETHELENMQPELAAACAQQKLALTASIEQQEQNFSALVAGLQLDLKQPRQWAVTRSLRNMWNNIERLTKQCHEQNQINGLILDNARRRILKRLDILHSISSEKLTYSANGNTINQHSAKLRERA